jgi:hypothetical protein
MKHYARITDPEKWGRVSFFKRTMRVKKVTHFGYVLMVVFLFFFSAYKTQEVSTLEVLNQKLNNALDLSEQHMDYALETLKKKCE